MLVISLLGNEEQPVIKMALELLEVVVAQLFLWLLFCMFVLLLDS